ncbi:MAG: glycosyltransferase family 2 protein [Actinomycetota bacterium]|nr:glycosyltransferase family 2 protein [Actinomycetota bacterium]
MTSVGSRSPSSGEHAAPDLGVVVVNYNAGPFIVRCLRSAFESAGDARLEAVVVDNASADGSTDLVLTEHPDVRIIQNDSNRGFATAANQGIVATSAPYVLLLNPDAEVTAGTLSGLLKVAKDRPRLGALGPLIREPDGRIYPSARKVPTASEAFGHLFLGLVHPDNRWSRAYTMSGWDRRSERLVDWVSGSCLLLNRAALDEVGLLDEGYFFGVEEVDLCTRMRNAGWDVMFTPELEVLHLGGVSRGRSRRITQEHARGIYRYFVKFRSPGWRMILRPFVWIALRVWAALLSRRRGDR